MNKYLLTLGLSLLIGFSTAQARTRRHKRHCHKRPVSFGFSVDCGRPAYRPVCQPVICEPVYEEVVYEPVVYHRPVYVERVRRPRFGFGINTRHFGFGFFG